MLEHYWRQTGGWDLGQRGLDHWAQTSTCHIKLIESIQCHFWSCECSLSSYLIITHQTVVVDLVYGRIQRIILTDTKVWWSLYIVDIGNGVDILEEPMDQFGHHSAIGSTQNIYRLHPRRDNHLFLIELSCDSTWPFYCNYKEILMHILLCYLFITVLWNCQQH